jgi:serine/threonine protein kinase
VATVYVRDVLCVLEYLHRSGVCHRDIKSENILVPPEGRCDDRLRREQGPVSEYRGRIDDAQHLRRKMFGVSLFPKAHRSAKTAGIIAPVRVRSTLSDGSRRRAQQVSVVFELVAFKDTVAAAAVSVALAEDDRTVCTCCGNDQRRAAASRR